MRLSILAFITFCLASPVCAFEVLGSGEVAASGGDGYTVTYEDMAYSNVSTTTYVQCAIPTGTASGELIVVTPNHDQGTATTGTNTGWTLIDTADGGSNFHAPSFYRVAGASEPSTYNLDITSTSQSGICVTQVFSNDGGTWAVSSSTVTDTTSTGSVTGYADGILLGVFYNDGSTETVSTGPSDMTEIYTQMELSVGVSTWRQATTDSSYSKSITWSGSEQVSSLLIAIGAE